MKKIIWEPILTRKTTPLLFSALGRGIAKAGFEALHIWNGIITTACVRKRDDREIKKIRQNFLKKITTNSKFGEGYLKKVLENTRKLERIIFPFFKENFSSFSEKKLFAAFDKIYFQLIKDGASIFPVYFLKQKRMENPKDVLGKNFRYFPYSFQISSIFDPELEKFLNQKLKNKEKATQYLSILETSPYITPIMEEKRDLLKAAIRYKKNQISKKELYQYLKKHLENYAWIPTDFGFGKFWTIRDIQKKSQRLLKSNLKDLKERLDEIEGYSKIYFLRKKQLLKS